MLISILTRVRVYRPNLPGLMKKCPSLVQTSLLVAAMLLTFRVSGVGAANPNFPNGTGDIRKDAPGDPEFDRAEPDDADGGYIPGLSVFGEQFELFGFAPA